WAITVMLPLRSPCQNRDRLYAATKSAMADSSACGVQNWVKSPTPPNAPFFHSIRRDRASPCADKNACRNARSHARYGWRLGDAFRLRGLALATACSFPRVLATMFRGRGLARWLSVACWFRVVFHVLKHSAHHVAERLATLRRAFLPLSPEPLR